LSLLKVSIYDFKKINGSLWCVYPKGRGVAYYVGHLKRAFVLFLKVRIMNVNLVPLAEMLCIEGISALEMADFFDELAFDYAQTVIQLQQEDLTPRIVLHEKTDHFLYLLRELREVFKKCSF